MPEFHRPVLLDETLELLGPKPGGVYLDATLGGGGFADALLERIAPHGVLVGIDRDLEAVEFARERLARHGGRAVLVRGNFRDVDAILNSLGIERIDGAAADLGVSLHQLESARGFSFLRDEHLDMRMSALEEETPTAARIVNAYTQAQLEAMIRLCGERFAGRIARAIVRRRQDKPITTTGELVDIVFSAVGGAYRESDIHPATRTFLSIRLEVNRELESLEAGLPAMVERLKFGGRVCVISFHSLEDRIVKTTFRRLSGRCECPPRLPECRCGARKLVKVITRKPITPIAEEIEANPPSRSAKLRGAERI